MAWPIVKLVTSGISAATGMVDGWQRRKTSKTNSKIKIEEANVDAGIKRLGKRGDADIAWEDTSLKQSGWKDEFWTIVIAIPMVMCFIPGLVQYVIAGFEALEQTPKWYQYLIATAVASAFGVKKFVTFMKTRKGE